MHEKRFEGDVARLRTQERIQRLEVDRVTELCLAGEEISRVLDVGTGTGLFAESFSKHGLEVSGVDANLEMLPSARQYVPKATFREGTAEALPYPDGSFDLVFLGLVLHEADDPLKALTEARRVTGKRVCILEWPYRDQPFGPPLSDRVKPEKLAGWIQKAGFRKWKSTDLANTIFYQLDV